MGFRNRSPPKRECVHGQPDRTAVPAAHSALRARKQAWELLKEALSSVFFFLFQK